MRLVHGLVPLCVAPRRACRSGPLSRCYRRGESLANCSSTEGVDRDARGDGATRARRLRWCRRWGRSRRAPRPGSRRGGSPTGSSPRSSSICASSGRTKSRPRRLPALPACARCPGLLEAEGVALLWAPERGEVLYPEGYATNVSVEGVSDGLCRRRSARPFRRRGDGRAEAVQPGPPRQGFLRREGLATARGDPPHGARSRPDAARMSMRSTALPIVREADGLAMSSRNALLSADERRAAPRLHAILQKAAREIRDGAAGGGDDCRRRDGRA